MDGAASLSSESADLKWLDKTLVTWSLWETPFVSGQSYVKMKWNAGFSGEVNGTELPYLCQFTPGNSIFCLILIFFWYKSFQLI